MGFVHYPPCFGALRRGTLHSKCNVSLIAYTRGRELYLSFRGRDSPEIRSFPCSPSRLVCSRRNFLCRLAAQALSRLRELDDAKRLRFCAGDPSNQAAAEGSRSIDPAA